MASALLRTPTAQTFTISHLMEQVREGLVRIPHFQRNYRWTAEDVLNLFDSVYRGYPIGSLLLWSSSAPHEVLTVGSLRIEAEATSSALWVVDGQQRITSLAGVLLSVGEIADARFSVFFDLERKRFVRSQRPAPHWLPMNRVIDTRALLRWLGELQRSGGADELVTTAEDLSRRVREYQLPSYVVETQDEATLRTIFDRLNTFGKALTSAEVFQALHGGRRGETPEDLRTLATQVADLGFGTFDDNTLLRAVLALRGADIYRDFRTEFSENEDPTDTFRAAAEAIGRMIAFLRSEASIPHVRIMPYRYVIPVLARFFHLHPKPSARSLTLLRRWIWRDVLTPGKRTPSVTSFREAVRAVDADENKTVQRLLRFVASSSEDPEADNLSARLNEAHARANTALMASWHPRSLIDGRLIDVADHLEHALKPLPIIISDRTWNASLADRMIHGTTSSSLQTLLIDSPLRHSDPLTFVEVLDSHAIMEESLGALEQGDTSQFLSVRSVNLQERLRESGSRLAEWGATDRPPISALTIDDGDSVD